MTVWIIVLRGAGMLIFLMGVVGVVYNQLRLPLPGDFWWLISNVWTPMIDRLILALLCFGVASGLSHLRRIDNRTRKHSWLFRRVFHPVSLDDTGEHRSVAPDAPEPANTAKYADEGEVIRRHQTYRR